jgi:uncharacterized membrane protein YccF (DUF307 family)
VSDKGYKWKMVGAYLWGIPWAIAGIAMCLTILGSPIGLLCFVIAGKPLELVQKTHLERMRAWKDRDRPMPNSAMPPWLSEEGEPDA